MCAVAAARGPKRGTNPRSIGGQIGSQLRPPLSHRLPCGGQICIRFWWARLDSNQRPANYESRKKSSDTVQRRGSKYRTSTPMSNKSAAVWQDPSDRQSRLAVKILAENSYSGPCISTLAAFACQVLPSEAWPSKPTDISWNDPVSARSPHTSRPLERNETAGNS